VHTNISHFLAPLVIVRTFNNSISTHHNVNIPYSSVSMSFVFNTFPFYLRNAVLAPVIATTTYPFACLSRAGIVSKRRKEC